MDLCYIGCAYGCLDCLGPQITTRKSGWGGTSAGVSYIIKRTNVQLNYGKLTMRPTLFRILMHLNFILLVLATVVTAQDKGSGKKKFIYGGAKTCKACHLVKKSGAQYKKWSEGPHARAYETLKSDQAKKWAKERGIEDPIQSEKCIKCHVTAYEVDASLKGPALKMEEGIGCETCHGAGSEYRKLKVMRDIYAGKLDGADYGLIKPTEEVCVTCHNKESPAFKEFNFEEMVAKIAHPVPKE